MDKTKKLKYCYIPEDLSIDSLSIPDILKKENLLYIISTIICFNKQKLKYNNFAPLSSEILRRKMRNYKKHLEFLLTHQIIITDGHYKKTKFSIGYAIHPKYRNSIIKPIGIKTRYKVKEPTKRNLRTVKHLLPSYENLEFDYIPALEFLHNRFKRKEINIEKYNHGLIVCDKFKNKEYTFSVDEKAGRFHHSISFMNKELRQFLKVNGEYLTQIDIKSSQPGTLTFLINYINGINESGDISISSNNLYNNIPFHSIISTIPSYLISHLISHTTQPIGYNAKHTALQVTTGNDISRYKSLVAEGRLYEYLQYEAETTLGMTFKNKKEFKSEIFRVFFTSNKHIGQPDAKFKKMFSQLFPTVYKLMVFLKKKNKAILPVMLQSIEAQVMLQCVTKELVKNDKHIPLFTVHDCIMTTPENVDVVKATIKKYFKALTGIEPALSVD